MHDGGHGSDEHARGVVRASVPAVPGGFVARPRLVRLVEAGAARGTVLVSAPAGSGKTLLLASWARLRASPVAWLSLEPEDGDPGRFWSRVLSALRSGSSSAGSPLADLEVPPRFDDRFVIRLLSACEHEAAPPTLVLDDLHELVGTTAMPSLAAALRRGPGALRLVIGTRIAPPLPLQRLRLSGALTEVSATDLEFTADEAAQLLAAQDVHLTRAQLAPVLDRTEGWAAGLRLAAISLHAALDLDEAVERLAGDQRTVADYFVEEVVSRQTPELTDFLLRTCVVRRLSSGLAEALTGRTDGQRMLERLERENLFVVALDDRRQWYRYHHLFSDLLRHRLRTHDPQAEADLHLRAADWFGAHDQVLEAARHLAEAQDWGRLSRYVLRCAGALLLGPERQALAAVLHRIPAAVVLSDPEAATAAAIASYAAYDAPGIRTHAAVARRLAGSLEPQDAPVVEAVLRTLEAVAAWLEGDTQEQVRCATDALDRLGHLSPAEVPAVGAYRMATVVVQGMGMLWTGRLAEAETLLRATMQALDARSALTPVLAVHLHGNLAVLLATRGRLREAEREAGVALDLAERSGWLFLPQSAMALVALSIVQLLRADAAACSVTVERAEASQGDLPEPLSESVVQLLRVRLHVTTGDVDAARARLASAFPDPGTRPMPHYLRAWVALVEAEVDLADGRAAQVHARLSAPPGQQPGTGARPAAQAVVLLARACLQLGRARECLDVLAPHLVRQPEDLAPAVDAWLLAALAHDHLRQDAEALTALGTALDLAVEDGVLRPFVLAGARVAPLLRRHLKVRLAHEDAVTALLQRLGGATPAAAGAPLLQPLTSRERSVLVLLPTMMSNAEIADELCVSVNTVKVHLKSLFRKLGVGNRRHCVVAARELGLLAADAPVPA